MTSKQRMLIALNRQEPDRIPVTVPHLTDYFLKKYMNDISPSNFYDLYNLDAIHRTSPHKPDTSVGDYYDPRLEEQEHPHPRWIFSDNWNVSLDSVSNERRFRITTPKGEMTTVLQVEKHIPNIIEPLIKNKKDIELIAKYAPIPACDNETVNKEAARLGERGLMFGEICSFGINNQSGIWQDAASLTGNDRLNALAEEDPDWVHELLRILQHRKAKYIKSLKGADYDLIEYGGDNSSTFISPKIYEKFVLGYESELIKFAHEAGQKIVYHVGGATIPLIEMIAETKPDAIGSFSAQEKGVSINLEKIKHDIGKNICLIGGLDPKRFLTNGRPDQTRKEVRRCFLAAGEMGGFILAPSEPFFDADPVLIEAFSDEARKCIYD